MFCDGEFFHGKNWESGERGDVGRNKRGVLGQKKIECNMDCDHDVDRQLNGLVWTVIRFGGDMWRTLIYYKPQYYDLAKKLRDNYIAHHKKADIISEEKQDDVEYARENQYDEAIFIEDLNTVIVHEIKSCYTNRCPISEVYSQ